MFPVDPSVYSIIYILVLAFVTATAAPTDGNSSGTNSNNTRALVCIGFCPQVSASVNPSRKCFSGDSWVSLLNGRQTSISHLRSGDRVWGFDGANVVASEMILMLAKNVYTEATFYTLQTDSNHTISLTGEHLIPIVSNNGMLNYIQAAGVKAGRDALYVLSKQQVLVRSRVIRVSIETKVGYYAPLTTTSTLMVNNVLASCFSHIHSHEIGQIFTAPIRWYHALSHYFSFIAAFNDERNLSYKDGLHWIRQVILNAAHRFCPSILHFS